MSLRSDIELFPQPDVPPKFFNEERLLAAMETRGLDGLVSYYAPNVYYLSGFVGTGSLPEIANKGAVVLSRHDPDHPILVMCDTYFSTLALQPTWIEDIRPYGGGLDALDLDGDSHPIDRFVTREAAATGWGARAREHYTTSVAATVRTAMRDLGLDEGRVGFDNLALAASVAGEGTEVVDAFGLMRFTRQVKTPYELERLRASTALNQLAIERTVAGWEQGMTWWELNRSYNIEATRLGGFLNDPVGLAVTNLRDGDPTQALPLAIGFEPDYEIEPGMNMMFDCHGTHHSYCWDGGKTWFVGGEGTDSARRTAKAAAETLRAIQAALQPGRSISEMQAIGRSVLRKAGIPNADSVLIFFHGLGLDHSDIELTSGQRDWPLSQGMVLSTHLAFPGDSSERYWIEDISEVRPEGGASFFTWDLDPF